MSRERFEKLFPVPDDVQWNEDGYCSASLTDEAVWAANHHDSMWTGFNSRQPEIDELVEALEMARFELVDYADDDAIASGHGGGCRSNPNESIRPTIERLDALIAKHKGKA